MALNDGPRSPGQPFKAPSAQLWNHMRSAGEAYRDKLLGNESAEAPPMRRTDTIKIRNSSGASRRAGEVLKLIGPLITDMTIEHPWFDGGEPELTKRFAILRRNVIDDAIEDAAINGIALALVTITSTSHRFARIADGEYVLESSYTGPVEILYAPDETGEQECLVMLRSANANTFGWVFKTPVGGIPARVGTACGSADCTPYYVTANGDLTEIRTDDDEAITEEVFNIFSSDVAGEVYITAKSSFGVLLVDAEDCG